MKNKITIISVLVIALMTLVFSSQSPLADKSFGIEQKVQAQSAYQIPPQILYDQMFRLVISFRKQAEIQQLTGERVTTLTNHFKDEAQLTDRENEILQQAALEFLQQVQPLDDQAIVLIAQVREANPDAQQIAPPQELTDLQQQRNALALSYRNLLSERLGGAAFGEFDNFMQGSFAAGFQSSSPSSEGLTYIADAPQIPIIYGDSVVQFNSAGRYVEGYSLSYMNYEAGLNFHPAVQGDLYRTDMPEPGLASGYKTGYGSTIAAEVFLFSANYVEGKTYCTSSTHFSIRRVTGERIVSGRTQQCKTIPFPATPTLTPTPTPTITPTVTPTVTPTPCPLSYAACLDTTIISVEVTPQALKPFGVSGGNNTATVSGCLRTQDNIPISNSPMNLKVYRHLQDQNTGGHIDTLHSGSRPVGKLDKFTGVTGSNGCFTTKYHPSHISGIVTVEAYQSASFYEFKRVFVGVPNLIQLTEGENFRLIGDDDYHPSNHWGSAQAIAGIPAIANAYKVRFYGNDTMPENDKLRINDSSLVYGGKFDLQQCASCKPDWHNLSRIHKYHREGNSVDIRCCSSPGQIPTSRKAAFIELALANGASRFLEERNPPHFHLSFNYEPNNAPESADDPLDTYTPHSFIENTWEVVMDRTSTQEEWERWHTRIVEAKAQGTSQLLAEAKVFKKGLFADSEYAARRRTDAEFVEDVFWAYLFREPTEAERQYWQNYMLNIPRIVPTNRRRPRMLADFESNAEFESLVLGIVDSD